ncbi:MAG: trypsin-like peptidase domain-containing protein [Anaerolineae bacterium]
MADLFKNISDELAQTVETASQGIVRVDGRKRLSATGFAWSDTHIVTADHVIRKEENLTVGLPSGETVNATLAGRDPNSDIAVLRVDGGLTALPRAAEGSLRVGHLVLALGKPGSQVQATLGVVSAIDARRMEGVITTDVVMYPGFSGGPLVDASGLVQGMNTSGFNRGASLTLSNRVLANVVDALIQHGRMRQGFLGVGAQPVRLPEDIAAQLNQEHGLMIASIEKDSPAANAKLYQGDIIVMVDGQATPHLDALLMLLTGDRVGKTVPAKVVRGGQVMDVSVTIGERL